MSPPRKHALLIAVNNSDPISLHPCYRIRSSYGALLGCENDVDLMKGLLLGSFGFPEESIRILKSREASSRAILGAVDELVDRVDRDDVVVVYYSGHGSRMADSEKKGQMRESIVPNDSSRRRFGACERQAELRCSDAMSFGERYSEELCGYRAGVVRSDENRDVFDVDIDRWVTRLNEKTPNVVLIFDSCHSGSISRDPFGEAAREVVGDVRPASEVFDGGRPSQFAGFADLVAVPRIRSGWLPVGRRGVVVAACRAVELSWEMKLGQEQTFHGALTYYLARALASLGPGASWRDVLERVAPQVSSEHYSQHPQIEGEIDQLVFGTEKAPPPSYLAVAAVEGEEVVLWGGIAHGVSPRSLWSVRPHGTRGRQEGEEVARVRIEEVRPVTARGRVVEKASKHPLEMGQRAFLLEQDLPGPGLVLAVTAPEDRRGALVERVGKSDLLSLVDEPGVDVMVRCLAPRDTVGPGDPCPFLGALDEWTWATVGRDGQLLARPRPDDDFGREGLAKDLDKLARFRGLRRLENPNPESRLHGGVELRLLDHRGEVLAVDEEYGMALVEDGGKVEWEIVNRLDREVWVSLVELACDHSVSVLVPRSGYSRFVPGGRKLGSRELLRVSRDYFDVEGGLPQNLPDGFPWATAEGPRREVGVSCFKLFVTLVRARFDFLEQEGTRFVPRYPLEELVWLYHSAEGTRTVVLPPREVTEDKDWTVVTKCLGIKRRLGDE